LLFPDDMVAELLSADPLFGYLLKPVPGAERLGLGDMHKQFRAALNFARDIGLLDGSRRRRRLRSRHFETCFQAAMELMTAYALNNRWGHQLEPDPAGSDRREGEYEILLSDSRRVFCEVKSPFHPDPIPPYGGSLAATGTSVRWISKSMRKARRQLPADRAAVLVFCVLSARVHECGRAGVYAREPSSHATEDGSWDSDCRPFRHVWSEYESMLNAGV